VGFEESTTEAHERRVTRCRSCQARIIWLKTAAAMNMPTDADTVEPQDTVYEHGRHVSHFATCPPSQSAPHAAMTAPGKD
jgi:hypothetical protein